MGSELDPFLQALDGNEHLPAAVMELHCGQGQYSGRCDITRGRGLLVALALRAGRFPSEGQDLPVSLTIGRHGRQWLWDRDFAGHQTRSRLSFDPIHGGVKEQFGALTVWIQPVPTATGLAIEIRRLSLFGIPCPRFLLPLSASTESEDSQSRFCFDISAHMPVIGLLIRYRGWLTKDNAKRGVA